MRQGAIAFLKELQESGEDFVFFKKNFVVAEPRQPGDYSAGASSAEESLEELERKISGCMRCRLSASRTRFVFGAGDPDADLMFVGEAPGREEDRQGLPFVGASGQLLTRIIASIGFTRNEVYITNMVKCRPPNNRDPVPDEIEACNDYLLAQIEKIKPKVIVTLGRYSAYYFHGREAPLRTLRGIVSEFNGIKVVSTYHPAALLRNTALKREVWNDMLLVRKIYDQQGGRPSSGEVYVPGKKRK